MIRFECDYGQGCVPEILEMLQRTNLDQTAGYGNDPYCNEARDRIRKLCDAPEADVHFLTGGTQTNATVISAVLKPHQGVLCAPTGHIACHETGAIEHAGHKVLVLDKALAKRAGGGTAAKADKKAIKQSKVTAPLIRQAMEEHLQSPVHEHMVQPGMVYLAMPSENGMMYTKAELQEIHDVCRSYDLPLFLDGARLGYGLTADGNDLSFKDIASLTDIFYIGGTKCGALFGEAVVITNKALQKDFRYAIKMCGGMLAKGRLLGIQFSVLLDGGAGRTLYEKVCRGAVEQAYRIRDAFAEQGIRLLYDSPTNQQFPVLTKKQQKKLAADFAFELWQPVSEDEDAVRFCTSWATSAQDVDKLLAAVKKL